MSRFHSQFYSIEKIVFRNRQHRYIQDNNGYLFAQARYPTKIKAEDLPPWYIYGRYYKRFGYLSTRGIVDMVYRPSKWSNHFLKDDCLVISYHGEIVVNEAELPSLDAFAGVDEYVWGNEILSIIWGAEKYSGYDISQLIKQIQDKANWMPEAFPHEFSNFTFDVKAYLDERTAEAEKRE